MLKYFIHGGDPVIKNILHTLNTEKVYHKHLIENNHPIDVKLVGIIHY